ncbi:MAG: energy-coupling factor transporter ATPase [Firmicutes bacterium]|nr:energy-coupling factor transporter ATPase [Dethiobacter sp.]MBS3888281.1 energy-coupling factor transporter ATPase [Bacillota bacterium]MBS4053625.1 energy-coupling factor transporter ATPase [Thermaerobacter sp.]
MTILEVEDLKHSYRGHEGDTVALAGVDLKVQQGEFVAVIGRNGSGKSTLAKHFNAILLPSGGRVLVEGLDTRDEALLWAVRQRVGMVFQHPDNQIVATIVEEDVAFGPENLGVPTQEIIERVDESLRQVGMEALRTHAPHLLSGGQKQRVAIAGVLAMRPKVIVLDEATAMLDPIGRAEVMNTILRLNKEQHMTAVLITHHMDEAVRADRVVVIDEGQVVLSGSPAEVFCQYELLESLGLDVPVATKLGIELERSGLPLPQHVLTAAQLVDELCQLN